MSGGLQARFQALSEGRRQALQFVAVGVSSVVIDWSLTWLFLNRMRWPYALGLSDDGAHWVAKAAAVSVATLNSFWWNSRYTFRQAAVGSRSRMLARFYGVILLGVVFNATLLTLFLRPFPGIHGGMVFWGAQGAATLIVTVWNFWASKRWVFRA